MKSRDCIAFWGVEYQNYLWVLLISLVMGFILTAVILAARKQQVWGKRLFTYGIVVSIIIFIALSLLLIYWQSTAIY